jgi:hypothetical protein
MGSSNWVQRCWCIVICQIWVSLPELGGLVVELQLAATVPLHCTAVQLAARKLPCM